MSDAVRSALPRRDFLRGGAIAAMVAGSAGGSAAPRSGATATPDAPAHPVARNVIFLVSDGASTGTITLADMAIRRLRGEHSWWCRLWTTPGARRAAVRTSAANSLVTDSAAGASAWGVGRKVNNGAVNVLPDGAAPSPLLVRARASGRATGLVTTTRVADATPGGFIANVPKRTLESIVAEQILERGVDVVLGGGRRSFAKEVLEDGGFEHARDAASLRAAVERMHGDPERRLLGLFASGSMPYELDRPDSLPTLAEMATLALTRLARLDEIRPGSQGFVVQIEGGRVDHAAHDNDAAAMVADQIAFDDAIGAALAFAARRDDTLIIVTTDHGNANPGLTVYGQAGDDGLGRLLDARHSFDWIKARFKRATRQDEAILAAETQNAEQHAASRPGLPAAGTPDAAGTAGRSGGSGLSGAAGASGTVAVATASVGHASAGSTAIDAEALDPASIAEGVFEQPDQTGQPDPALRRDHAALLGELVREAMGVALAPEEVAWVLRRLAGSELVNGFTESDTPEAALGSVLANHFGVSFMSTNHTADLVDAVALGPGAERMPPLMENTDLHGIVVDALRLGA